LKGSCDETFRLRRFCTEQSLNELTIDSKIISDIPSPLKQFENRKWNLLYRGSRDGFQGSNFHSKCDGQSNTLTLILTTKDFIFGGFTPIAWDSSNSYKTDNSNQSFLLSIKNARNTEPQSFPLVNSAKAIHCYFSHGPKFGYGYDIYVANGCNENSSSYTHLGNGYRNDTELNGKEVFTGERQFQVKEIEVFTITL
jgi:hypothetical protein